MISTTNIDDVIIFITKFADPEGIPIIVEKNWEDLNDKFTKEEIKEGLAEYISRRSVLFPFRKIILEDVSDKFYNLRTTNFMDFIMENPRTVVEKYDDYQYPYSKHGKFVISFGHYYNDVSNFFQQRNRYDCGSHGFPSPNEYWYSPDLLKKMNWTFWRLDNHGINHEKIRGSFRLGAYVATQFKPHVAKTLYDFIFSRIESTHKSVLDISMGWGDRLAGFYASKAINYFGTDPNPSVYEVYKKQCVEYEKLLSGIEPTITIMQISHGNHLDEGFVCVGASGKTVTAYNAPAEDILPTIKNNKYDCIFTSPPYFSTELYDQGGDDWKQSWSRYPQYHHWWNEFFRPVIAACYESLTPTGILMMNIMDPFVRGFRSKTCDQMVNYVASIGGKFDGQIGMRIKQRPKNISSDKLSHHLSTTYIENIWCFSQNGFDLSINPATLENLFGE